MTSISPAHLAAAPYPGLRPFKHTEANIFFGREEQTDQLLKKLQTSRFLGVVGPSGCGKSSLVRAGMIPALGAGFLAEAGARWRVAEMRPGEHPLARLAEALASERALGPERGKGRNVTAFLQATLRRGPLGLVDALRETPLPEGANLLVLVDQFEEIFRFRREGNPEEADAFVALLLATAEQKVAPVYVVITMRSDYLGDCALFSGLPEALNESQFLTPRLSREQSEAAIVKPARVFGGRIEPELVTHLLNDMGTDPDQLPLLQHCLMRMWTRVGERKRADDSREGSATMSLEDYLAVGGLGKALSNHANEVLESLKPEHRRVAEVMFRRLTERSRGASRRDTRRPARLGDIALVAVATPEEVATVAGEFRRRDRSFLTPPQNISLTPQTVLDISHESLISLWDKLDEWATDEARSAAFYERLKQTAQLWPEDAALWGGVDLKRALEWKGRQEPTLEWALRYGTKEEYAQAMTFLDASEADWEEKERAREARLERERQADIERQAALRYKKMSAGLALIGLLAAALAVFAVFQRGVAEAKSLEATEQAKRAETQTRLAEANADEAQRERATAAENARQATQSSDAAKASEQRAKAEALEAARQKAIALQALNDLRIEKGKTDKALADLKVEKGKADKALADLQVEKDNAETARDEAETAREEAEAASDKLAQKVLELEEANAKFREEQRLTTVLKEALKGDGGGDTPVNNQKTTGVSLQLTGAGGGTVAGSLRVSLTDVVENRRVTLDYDPSSPRTLALKDFPAGAPRVYRVEVSGSAYRPVSGFVTIKPGEVTPVPLKLPIDPAKVDADRVDFPPFGKLPGEARRILNESSNVKSFENKRGEGLYAALDNIRRAGLLNIFAKAQATKLDNDDNVLTFVREILEIRGDRFLARVSKELRDEIRDAVKGGTFVQVSDSLYKPPDGFQNAGSFKTVDRFGNLQVTLFATGDDEYIADIDVDEASGLEHIFQVLRHQMTGSRTHPFDIQQILLQQNINPGYTLKVDPGTTPRPEN